MRILHIWLILVSSTLLMSCASNRIVTIDSQPQGTSIIADGKEIGKTPLKIEPDEVFPPRWVGSSYMVKGKLELKKPECEPVAMDVNDYVLSNNINQQLKCSDKLVNSTHPPANPQYEKAIQPDENIAQRLEKLNQLREKNLVTEEEYKTQRQRILNEL